MYESLESTFRRVKDMNLNGKEKAARNLLLLKRLNMNETCYDIDQMLDVSDTKLSKYNC